MKVFYSPVRSDDKIEYAIEGTTITCTLNGEQQGVYDVTELEGMDVNDYEGFMPVRSVELDEAGVYWVRLIHYHELDAPEAERFPDWVEV